MATTITINGSVTLDESLGLQNGLGTPPPGEDNNDSDVALGTLQSTVATFSNRLFNSVGTGGLGLSSTFATNNGVAESASNFITVSGGTVASLGFVDGNGGALPVYTPGVNPSSGVLVTGFSALDGGAIHLFEDATSGSGLGDRMALGVDTQGNIVFAVFMDPTADLTSARVWMVQFEAISNPNAANPDDSVNLFDTIGVAASTSLHFDFNSLHSGSNLFGMVGDASNALIVIAEHPVLSADGKLVSSPNGVIKTSQGGGPTTIGVNSQMFDPGEGAYFTYVNNPNTDFLGANLSQTEANDSADIQYTGGTLAVTGASTTITQTQGNGPATMLITAFDIGDSPTGRDFVDGSVTGNGLGSGTKVPITSVTIKHANGTTESETAGGPDTSTHISFDANGVATVSGLGSGDTIAWTTSAPHDRVLIEGGGGKFDIGGFDITQTSSSAVDIGQQLTFEDDGPTAAIATTAATVVHDESSGAQSANGATDTATAPVAALVPNVAGGVSNASTDYQTDDPTGNIYAQSASAVVSSTGSSTGADEEGATTAFSLSVAPGGVDSGVTTTAGTKIFLFSENGLIVGRIGATAGVAATGQAAFAVTINSSTGVLSTAQYASLHHDTASNPDTSEAASIANTALQAVVTVTDGDNDTATKSVDIGNKVQFLDDGPTIGPIADSTVDFTNGATATQSLVGVVGADQNNAPYTIVGTSAVGSFPDISLNGTTLRPALSNNNETLTYNAAGTDGTFGTADDVPFYRLTLSETDNSGAGSYTFTVLVNPQPAKLTFDLSTLASGQNLWGAAADTSKATGFEVFANNVTLNADGTQASGGTTNTSKGGGPTTIGISNQMFDPGEGAFFTYVTNPTTGGTKDADDINYNGLFQATEAQAAISQTQGNTSVEVTVKAFEISSPVSPDPTLGRDLISGAGSGSPVSITEVHIFDSTGHDVTNTGGRSFTINAGVADIKGLVAGDTFDWTTGSNHDQVLISDVTGKWDIGAFNIIQTQPTPAQDLPFKVQATDGDSDFAQASFNVHINPVVA